MKSGEGLLTEPTAAAQIREQEPLFMPRTRHSSIPHRSAELGGQLSFAATRPDDEVAPLAPLARAGGRGLIFAPEVCGIQRRRLTPISGRPRVRASLGLLLPGARGRGVVLGFQSKNPGFFRRFFEGLPSGGNAAHKRVASLAFQNCFACGIARVDGNEGLSDLLD